MASKQQQNDGGLPKNVTGQHRCSYCAVTFTRSEHLKRHQTMHTNLRPFACMFCSKKFGRSDVLSRHYQTCKPTQQMGRLPVKASQRVNRACSSCRVSKAKCSGTQPCERCCSIGQGDLCRFTLRKPRRANSASDNITRSQDREDSTEQHHNQHELPTQRGGLCNITIGNDSSTAMPEVVQDVSLYEALQQTPQPLNRDSRDQCEDGLLMDLELGQDNVPSRYSDSLPDIGFTNGTVDVNLSGLGPDISFDLDPLDWGLLDHALMAFENADPTDTTTSGSSQQGRQSPSIPMAQADRIEYGIDRAATKLTLPAGINIMQISPLEAHRTQILEYLNRAGLRGRRWESWLSFDTMSVYIRSYFSCFHHHTPLLHLPSWNVATTSTRLIFSIILMGAMYSGNLKSRSNEAQQLCQLAQSFAWESDYGLDMEDCAQLDTIQAVYIASLLEAFYCPKKGPRLGIDMTRLVNEARNAGVFQPLQSGTDPWKMKWNEWSAQECRVRTAFILYLFDAVQAILFDRRPELQLHELHLPLPCDEGIFTATSADEWHQLCLNAQNLTRVEYPLVLSLFFCHRPIDVPLYFSVMGAFTILHGILLHMWEQKSMHMRTELSDDLDSADQNVRNRLASVQSQLIDNALRMWRNYWDGTISRPSPTASHGLYRDRALVYWFLGNAMNRSNISWSTELPAVSAKGQWTLKNLRLLRRLSVLVDSGQLDDASHGISNGSGKLDRYLRDLQHTADIDGGAEEVDTTILSYMMRKDC